MVKQRTLEGRGLVIMGASGSGINLYVSDATGGNPLYAKIHGRYGYSS